LARALRPDRRRRIQVRAGSEDRGAPAAVDDETASGSGRPHGHRDRIRSPGERCEAARVLAGRHCRHRGFHREGGRTARNPAGHQGGRSRFGVRSEPERMRGLAHSWAMALLALLAPIEATARATDPRVPPGTDPGGIAVALISTGIDYTLPHISA